jgi:iron(III) transport system ATP-binding protein
MDLLTVNGIGKKENEIYLVQQVSFSQPPLQRIAIAGETGSGKTSVLKMIAGLLQPDEGAVFFQGERVLGPFEKLIPGHPRIAYLSQHFELRNNYRVEEELESKNRLTADEAANVYKVCRVDHLLKRKTTELSGGERQRIVLARLLTTSPLLLLLDEPFSNLDALHKSIIKSVLDDISNTLGLSCIMVSHDGTDLLSWADMIIVLKDGKIIQQGTPSELYNRPVNEYCAGLFGEYNLAADKTATQLLPSGAMVPEGKKLLLRPEQLLLAGATAQSVSGVGENIFYYGAYDILAIKTEGELLRVRSSDNKNRTGDRVHLSLKDNHYWYLPVCNNTGEII